MWNLNEADEERWETNLKNAPSPQASTFRALNEMKLVLRTMLVNFTRGKQELFRRPQAH